jgi:SpoU rRNA methylase family enzyme
MGHDLDVRSPVRLLTAALEGDLGVGQVGVVVSRAGVGKTALLVHLALDALLQDQGVMHVALRDSVDHVRSYYDEIFAGLAKAGRVRDKSSTMVAAERHRMIHSYVNREFSVQHLSENLEMLRDVAEFRPRLLVIDGLEPDAASSTVAGIKSLAAKLGVPVWLTVRSSDACIPEPVWDASSVGIRLVAEGRTVGLSVLRHEEEDEALSATLDPETMLVIGEEGDEPVRPTHTPRPAECTLYSGGANGAEAAFGEACEAWGVHEVNFTFEGHKQVRGRGRYELSPRELAAGDVSLVYVSRRLNRTYSEGSLIRRVLQTLWHMVSRSQQVFVIGQIQDDGTVVGGTGWSVELARMWNKSLWVYDQDQNGWFRWDGESWIPGTPLITSIHFTGTGTRYLTDEGRAAIRDLFARSFGE